jgi:DnaK suppressor protein
MRKRELDKYGAALLAKRQVLLEKRIQDNSSSRERGSDGGEDYIDYAVSSYAKEFLLSLSDLERKQLVLVEEALRRIEDRSYGKCLACAAQIDKKRLTAAPWARHCMPCQELEEKGMLPDAGIREIGTDE